MRNLILSAIALCVVSCSSPSRRHHSAESDASMYYSTDHVQCVKISIIGYNANDSSVSYNEEYFVKKSNKIGKFVDDATKAMFTYNNEVVTVKVDTIDIIVNR